MNAKSIQQILDEQRQTAEIYKKSQKQISSIIASNLLVQDPNWIKAHREGISTPEYKQKLKEGHKRFWETATDEYRNQRAQTSFDAKISFASKEQATEIFWLCWGPDRGEKLYKKLAKKYNVGYEGIINLVRGGQRGHEYCPVNDITLEKMKQDWREKYQTYKVCAVIPGNDQLDNYDRLYKESGLYNKAGQANKLATPNVVFYCRFILKNPTPQTVKEYCDSIGIPKVYNDMSQYNNILYKKFPWLTNKPSETVEFDSYEELAEFLNDHPANKGIRQVSRELAWDYVKHRIQWKGNNFLGWMFYKKEI